jgi:hypothetical protein
MGYKARVSTTSAERPAEGIPPAGGQPGDERTLRQEHDRLAKVLAARRSIDHVRRGAYAAFGALVTSGLSAKFGWDHWLGPVEKRYRGAPSLFFVALVLAVGALVIAARAVVLARRDFRVERRDFAQFQELRARLGIDP